MGCGYLFRLRKRIYRHRTSHRSHESLVVVAVVQNTCTFHSARCTMPQHLNQTINQHNFIPFSEWQSTSVLRSMLVVSVVTQSMFVHGNDHTFICRPMPTFYSAMRNHSAANTRKKKKWKKNVFIAVATLFSDVDDVIVTNTHTHSTHMRHTFIGYCSCRKENCACGCAAVTMAHRKS